MDFELDDSLDRVDRDVLWDFLSSQAYWSRWRSRDDLERQLAGAWRVVGAYERPGGRMVGFARAFSDGVASAYLADVFTVPEARGHGVGKALVRTVIDEGPGREFRWMLHTDDAHGLYRGFGFAEADQTYMERRPSGSRAQPTAGGVEG
ncbi:acetyltransferase (GNAT) family protein [Saccharopolyspora erythraea NRRL 2338]|uniref:Acetyltransferase (GNAT) family protein n=2 Tax=Saccharopolyspora erythraea TaxID=1836 RepID=A4F8E5_SACEN|nr:GNAT family N-acetyltransferase [Saccharopolyspora erythraea]EQD82271.1 GNAT family acetyltransferase [Saccharopolyspora erythraea D]PFG94115.1 acetyltransferase (GNAT) family protein [Saccharopolyspora erythraea NRRL 2338]QRK90904.1 GNAT family N-acetyltransferase [Saccharopolyspora erythraea]CAM00320.1 acetyltransferase (GNAT) family protein [Saccharopolyspora erythraea NRRL 2338]